MDYDKTAMPAAYDRARTYQPEVLRLWLEAISLEVPKTEVDHIIDFGCGTGRYSGPLSVHFDAELTGIEPSEKMLAEASAKAPSDRVRFCRAAGEALPLADGCADLVFISMVLHHLADPARAAMECGRTLRPGGRLALRTGSTEQSVSYPYIPFFSGLLEIIRERLPSRARIRQLFEDAGLELASHRVIKHQFAASWPAYADKLALRADSFLASLPDPAFNTGLDALRAHAEEQDPGKPIREDIDFFVFRKPAA